MKPGKRAEYSICVLGVEGYQEGQKDLSGKTWGKELKRIEDHEFSRRSNFLRVPLNRSGMTLLRKG